MIAELKTFPATSLTTGNSKSCNCARFGQSLLEIVLEKLLVVEWLPDKMYRWLAIVVTASSFAMTSFAQSLQWSQDLRVRLACKGRDDPEGDRIRRLSSLGG